MDLTLFPLRHYCTLLEELDLLAELLLEPDRNFEELLRWWETRRQFRDLSSPLV